MVGPQLPSIATADHVAWLGQNSTAPDVGHAQVYLDFTLTMLTQALLALQRGHSRAGIVDVHAYDRGAPLTDDAMRALSDRLTAEYSGSFTCARLLTRVIEIDTLFQFGPPRPG